MTILLPQNTKCCPLSVTCSLVIDWLIIFRLTKRVQIISWVLLIADSLFCMWLEPAWRHQTHSGRLKNRVYYALSTAKDKWCQFRYSLSFLDITFSFLTSFLLFLQAEVESYRSADRSLLLCNLHLYHGSFTSHFAWSWLKTVNHGTKSNSVLVTMIYW